MTRKTCSQSPNPEATAVNHSVYFLPVSPLYTFMLDMFSFSKYIY